MKNSSQILADRSVIPDDAKQGFVCVNRITHAQPDAVIHAEGSDGGRPLQCWQVSTVPREHRCDVFQRVRSVPSNETLCRQTLSIPNLRIRVALAVIEMHQAGPRLFQAGKPTCELVKNRNSD